MNSTVSVVIPIYNAEKYIKETIDSVFNQTYQDFEIIAVNDGSTDKSLDVIQKLASQSDKIKVINKVNTGVSDTRNVGIVNSKGGYIAFLDADDVWEFDKLEKQINGLNANPENGWCFCLCSYIDAVGNFIDGQIGEPPTSDQFRELITWKTKSFLGMMSNLVVKTSFLGDIRFNIKISSPADRDFAIRLAKKGNAFFIDQKLWRYRQHGNNMSSNYGKVIQEMDLMYKMFIEDDFFGNKKIKREALSNIYYMLGATCLKHIKSPVKGFSYMLKSLYFDPLIFFRKKTN